MAAEHRFNPHEIEPKWQAIWERERTWEVSNDGDGSPSSYVLEMLPYPSGEPHMGHLKNYAVGDVVAHFQRRIGRRVLHPMGYDAFGLPAENHAIKTGVHPRESTAASIAILMLSQHARAFAESLGLVSPRSFRPPGAIALIATPVSRAACTYSSRNAASSAWPSSGSPELRCIASKPSAAARLP